MRLEGGSGARRKMEASGLYEFFRDHTLPTPMASDGMKDGAGAARDRAPLRMILATPRRSDADRGGRGDVLSQLQGHASRHAGMMPTPVKPNGGRRLSRQEARRGAGRTARSAGRHRRTCCVMRRKSSPPRRSGTADGQLESGIRPQEIADDGRGDGRRDDRPGAGQMGERPRARRCCGAVG